MLCRSWLGWLSLPSIAFASAIPLQAEPYTPANAVAPRQATSTPLPGIPDGDCVNTARTRGCWGNGYSISTDFDAKSPPDGKVVTYDLEISNTTIPQPDGSGGQRLAMLINGIYPGPTIRAKWGDTLVINVKNNLQHNGTGLHWHGIRQLNSCQHDGVPGVTECPIAPGETRQYKFRATQFGTTWYHSHWSAQYGDGIVGTMIIDGPATAPYDEDLGVLPLTDWYYPPALTLNEVAQHSGPPTPNNFLVNGTHVNANGGGKYFNMTITKGKKYRIRLINTSVDNVFHVSADGHPFKVITSDFVPIKPYDATQITLAIGQRYDVVIDANQAVDNYWFRVTVGTGRCGSNAILSAKLPNGDPLPLGAILHYSNATNALPTSKTNVTMRTGCDDETNLVPFVYNEVPESVVPQAGKLNLNVTRNATQDNVFRWLIDGSPHIVNWNDPSLETVLDDKTDFGPNSNVHLMESDGWYLWWIQSVNGIAPALPHPIHLHGHDFYLVGRGTGQWDGTTNGLTFKNPTRRDTATLPGGGYMLIAFPADNPGTWIMHCHIAWHASQGLSMQFLERRGEIKGKIGNTDEFRKGCKAWDGYWFDGNPDKPYNQTDSGI